MAKIIATLLIDEEILRSMSLENSPNEEYFLEDTFKREMGWVEASGIFVESYNVITEVQKEYEPMCPFGYTDCIYDINYIKCYSPDWYKELGSPTECNCQDGKNYDDENK